MPLGVPTSTRSAPAPTPPESLSPAEILDLLARCGIQTGDIAVLARPIDGFAIRRRREVIIRHRTHAGLPQHLGIRRGLDFLQLGSLILGVAPKQIGRASCR